LRFGHPLLFHPCVRALPRIDRAYVQLRLEQMKKNGERLSFVASSDSPLDDVQAFVRHTFKAHMKMTQFKFDSMEHEWEQWWVEDIEKDFFGAVCTLADNQDACSTFLLAEHHGEGAASLVWDSSLREPHVLRHVFEFVCGEPYYGVPSPPPHKRRKMV